MNLLSFILAMGIIKEIKDQQLYLYIDGTLIYKRCLDTGQYKVLHDTAYNKYNLARDMSYDYRDKLIIVKARIRMKATKEGGRIHGFTSGYRPNHVFEYREDGTLQRTYIGDIVFEGQSTIEPGEEKIATVRFSRHQPIEKYLNIGRKWWIHESYKCLGEAEIIEIPSQND